VQFFTDFADQAVILPLLVAVVAVLLVQGRRRAAFAWTVAVPGTLGATLVAKMLTFACGWMVPAVAAFDLRSPSGHTAAATVAYATLTMLLGMRPRWAVAGAVVIAVVVAMSRLTLAYHTRADVVVGGVIGVGGAVVSALLMGARPPSWRSWPLAIAVVLVLGVMHGRHLHAEEVIRDKGWLYRIPLLSACKP
jgi:membrane-associated phospholipid phosphatase